MNSRISSFYARAFSSFYSAKMHANKTTSLSKKSIATMFTESTHRGQSTTVSNITVNTAIASDITASNGTDNVAREYSDGAIAGIVIGTLCAAAIVIALVIYLVWRIKKRSTLSKTGPILPSSSKYRVRLSAENEEAPNSTSTNSPQKPDALYNNLREDGTFVYSNTQHGDLNYKVFENLNSDGLEYENYENLAADVDHADHYGKTPGSPAKPSQQLEGQGNINENKPAHNVNLHINAYNNIANENTLIGENIPETNDGTSNKITISADDRTVYSSVKNYGIGGLKTSLTFELDNPDVNLKATDNDDDTIGNNKNGDSVTSGKAEKPWKRNNNMRQAKSSCITTSDRHINKDGVLFQKPLSTPDAEMYSLARPIVNITTQNAQQSFPANDKHEEDEQNKGLEENSNIYFELEKCSQEVHLNLELENKVEKNITGEMNVASETSNIYFQLEKELSLQDTSIS